MSNLTLELQKQIEQEAKSSAANFNYYPGSEECGDLESAYVTGASKYALKWQAAEARAARYEKALREIQAKAKRGIFPHLPVETMGAQMCIEIDGYITELFTHKTSTGDTDNG